MQTFVQALGRPRPTILTTYVIAGSLIFASLLQPIYGAISDRIGRKPLLIFFGVAGTLLDRADPHDAAGHQVALDRVPADLAAPGSSWPAIPRSTRW